MARLKCNNSFSLIEVLITVAILSTAIVFIFRSFTASLAAVKFSQNITLACLLTEEKLFEIEERQAPGASEYAEGRENLAEREFKWNYQTTPLEDSDLAELKFNVSWQENARENEYAIDFFTYLITKK